MINGPLLSGISAIFLKAFGQEMIITRILAIILDTLIIIMSYKIMEKLEIKDYLKYIVVIILAIIMKKYFTLDYNWGTLFLTLSIIYIEISKETSYKKEMVIGLLAGTTITLKQTTGLIIVLGTLGYNLLTVRNKQDLKKYIKNTLIRFSGVAIVLAIFIITLLKLNVINEYIDYCILGIKTFSNKVSYVQRLVKNEDIPIRILSIVPLFIYSILGYKYIKTNQKQYIILLAYSIVQMSVVYPISDEAHFVLAVTPTVISIGYLLNKLTEKVKVSEKEEIFVSTFLKGCIITFSVAYFIYGINNYRMQNINTELEHYKYLPMSQQEIDGIKQIDDFIKNQNKNVYILDASAALYMIPIDKYNKDFDMFNKGNLGSKGEEGQIEKIKKLENKMTLIKSPKYSRNWQNPEKVRKYIVQNMVKTGEIGAFDIYE